MSEARESAFSEQERAVYWEVTITRLGAVLAYWNELVKR